MSDGEQGLLFSLMAGDRTFCWVFSVARGIIQCKPPSQGNAVSSVALIPSPTQ